MNIKCLTGLALSLAATTTFAQTYDISWHTIAGGGGTGATATATTSGGYVTGLALVNGGSGFSSSPTVTISGLGPSRLGLGGPGCRHRRQRRRRQQYSLAHTIPLTREARIKVSIRLRNESIPNTEGIEISIRGR